MRVASALHRVMVCKPSGSWIHDNFSSIPYMAPLGSKILEAAGHILCVAEKPQPRTQFSKKFISLDHVGSLACAGMCQETKQPITAAKMAMITAETFSPSRASLGETTIKERRKRDLAQAVHRDHIGTIDREKRWNNR